MIENKKYFIDTINSSKAYRMTSLYHYSGEGFKKAILNLGIFRKEDYKLVGVLQFGCSFQDKIRLDRYVKEPIKKEEYLELNRFCMADSEGKNSESQAISLGIKWIKKYRPDIRLLVSYAGRKEGNYGYIYQATNWEYLGYFVSEGFWFIDGRERHLSTVWHLYKQYGNLNKSFLESLCDTYEDIRKTWTKQFIYIIRLDKKLTPASAILPYPKPTTDFPIKLKEKIYKQNDEVFNNPILKERIFVEYFYEKEKQLFSTRTLVRRGETIPTSQKKIAIYNNLGQIEKIVDNIKEIEDNIYKSDGIRRALKNEKIYKQKYFRFFEKEPLQQIKIPYICIIDNIPFCSLVEAGAYLNVSKQAVFNARKRRQQTIQGKKIIWNNEDNLS